MLVLPPGALEVKTRAAAVKASFALVVAGGEEGLPRPGEVVGLAPAKMEGLTRIGGRHRPVMRRRRKEKDKVDGENLEEEGAFVFFFFLMPDLVVVIGFTSTAAAAAAAAAVMCVGEEGGDAAPAAVGAAKTVLAAVGSSFSSGGSTRIIFDSSACGWASIGGSTSFMAVVMICRYAGDDDKGKEEADPATDGRVREGEGAVSTTVAASCTSSVYCCLNGGGGGGGDPSGMVGAAKPGGRGRNKEKECQGRRGSGWTFFIMT